MLFRWYVVKKLNLIKIILVFSILIFSGCGTQSYQRAIYDNQAEDVGLEAGEYTKVNDRKSIQMIIKTSNNKYNVDKGMYIIAKRLSGKYYLIQFNPAPFSYYVIYVVGKRQYKIFEFKENELKQFAINNGIKITESKGEYITSTIYHTSSGTALFNFFQKVVIEKPSILRDGATYKK
jgi:hypothetical protein